MGIDCIGVGLFLEQIIHLDVHVGIWTVSNESRPIVLIETPWLTTTKTTCRTRTHLNNESTVKTKFLRSFRTVRGGMKPAREWLCQRIH